MRSGVSFFGATLPANHLHSGFNPRLGITLENVSLRGAILQLNYLQITWPAVYICAQQTADKYRKNTCKSYVLTNPVMHPQNIWVAIPITMTLRGLKLKQEQEENVFTAPLFMTRAHRSITLQQ